MALIIDYKPEPCGRPWYSFKPGELFHSLEYKEFLWLRVTTGCVCLRGNRRTNQCIDRTLADRITSLKECVLFHGSATIYNKDCD